MEPNNTSQNTEQSAETNSTIPVAPTQSAGDNATLMAVLAYIGPLVIISYLVAKDTPFVKFHIKQGAVLFVIEVAAWFIGMSIFLLFPLIGLINIAMIIFSVIGIVNVLQGKEKELPLLGKFGAHFKI